MAYQKIGFENKPSTKSPINAENLNHMDEGIFNAHKALEEIDILKANAIVTKASGETIAITDSANVPPLNIIPYGKSTQKAYEGNQLFDAKTCLASQIEAGLVTVNDDGSVVIHDGSVFNNSNRHFKVPVKAGSYYFKETTQTLHQLSNGDGFWANYITFTEDTLLGCYIAQGSYTNRVIEPIISVAKDVPLEPYVGGEPSPNINYSQEVVPHGASGSIGFGVLDKNLCPKNLLKKGWYGVGDIMGKPTTNSSFPNAVYGMPIEHRFNETLAWNFGTVDANDVRLRLVHSDGTIDYVYQSINGTSGTTLLQVPDIAYIIPLFLLGVPDTCIIEYSNTVPTVDNSQPMTYQTPNGLHGIPLGATIPSVIANSEIHMRGVYHDGEQYWISDTRNENGKDVQRILETVFDGSSDEKWLIDGANRYRTNIIDVSTSKIITPSSSSIVGNAICTHAIIGYSNSTNEHKHIGMSLDWNGRIQFYLGETEPNLEAWNTRLSENPITCYFVLAEPIVTDTTEEELAQFNALRMNYPNTTIVNDAGAYTKVEYVADTKCYIDKKFKELETALANTNAQLL